MSNNSMAQLELFEVHEVQTDEIETIDIGTKVILSITEIMDMYLNDEDPETAGRPWAVAWSGGKDSTTVLKLVCQALLSIPEEKRKRTIRVVMSDTKMENPILVSYMYNQVRLVNKWAEKNAMPLSAKVVSRKLKRSMFVGWIGKGWTLPTNGDDRYCTHALKIDPQNAAVEDIDPCLILIGSRNDESIRRSMTIEKYQEEKGSRFSFSSYNKGRRVYMPVLEYSEKEIWQVLLNPLPWGSSDQIRTLYKDATGECALVNPIGSKKATKACGARFGCWTCPPITKDRSTENLSRVHEWMEPLTEWRALLKDMHNPKKNGHHRSGYRRDMTPCGPGKGCLAITGRKILLEKLLETQDDVNRLRTFDTNPLNRAPIELITTEEIEAIRDSWLEDELKKPWLIDNSEMVPGDWVRAAVRNEERQINKQIKKGKRPAEDIRILIPI